ncbi:winged helix-turn-helix domain-containing protein [Arenimonas terrae]|uniref:OmpR/PhoB-type domain-containing protein n=1 Tax=Arenimonas terrae TaxID=2546226 RepID=A0A5C4RPY8_9GAMM|nr:winged helix-turn-helix domain-containing protein [Arenimonas terrae]TNJ33220.1 hypothetical protein E1B00_13050 [Arenimonas terrae]
MLNSHKLLIAQRPSDRVRVGDHLVDLPIREIASADGSGEPVRITLKAQGVLLVMIAHAGQVVSRETLMERVWPDTLPNEEVLTQAIALLRKAFASRAYIETISKHGYRLVAPVEWVLSGDADAPSAPRSPRDHASSGRPGRCARSAAAPHSVALGGFRRTRGSGGRRSVEVRAEPFFRGSPRAGRTPQ